MFLDLLYLSRRFIPTIASRQNGHIRPRNRALGAPVVHPNIRLRCSDYELFEDRNGKYTLIPETRRNPSLNVAEILAGTNGTKYRREWLVNLKPYKWLKNDVKLPNGNING